MDAKQTNQNFDLVAFVGGLVKLRKSGQYFIGPCPMCGGRDRFQVKRTTDGDCWICRGCAPEKYHSPVDFFMAYRGLDFKAALGAMGADWQPPRREIGNGQPVGDPAPVQVLPDPAWQAEAWTQIDEASDRMLGSEGEPGRRYLVRRGISRGSIYRDLLGFAIVYKRPAIVIPWLDLGNVITAVKYRFIDDLARKDRSRRYACLSGSQPYLFGLQHVLSSDHTLLFVEGELNAVSVLQALPRGVSVVSAGSDSNGNAALLRALAAHYGRVFVWADELEKAQAVQEKMHRRDAQLLKSPVIEGRKWDANEMLREGLLMDFLRRTLSTECLGIPSPVEAGAI